MCTLLVFFYPSECNGTTTTNTTTTTVTLTSTPNCNLSISGITYDNSLATQLTPGKVYEIVFVCLNCTKNVTMSKSFYFVESLLFQILTMSTTMTLYVFPVLYIKCIVLPIFSSLSLKSRFLFFSTTLDQREIVLSMEYRSLMALSLSLWLKQQLQSWLLVSIMT